MAVLIFASIALIYSYYASRDRIHALVGAAVLLPYSQYIPSAGVPLFNIQTVVVGALIVSLVRGAGRPDRPRPRAPLALVLFTAAVIVAYARSFFVELPRPYDVLYDPWRNFVFFKEWLSVLFVFYAAYMLTESPKDVRKVFWGAVLGLSGETVFCFLELVLKGGRVTGHLGNPNGTGAFLATYAAFCLGAFGSWRKTARRWPFLVLSLAGAAATMGTRSRGGFLALASAFLVASLAKSRVLFLVLLTLGLTYSYWLPAPLMNRFEHAYTVDENGEVEATGTAEQRIEIWKAGLRTIPDYPLGIGFGNYRMIVPKYGLEGVLNHPSKNAHNDYVLITVEEGILGFLAFLALIIGAGYRAWFAAHRDEDTLAKAAAYAAFSGLLAAMAASIAGTNLMHLNQMGILWLVLGMSARRANEIRQVAGQRTNLDFGSQRGGA